MHQTLTKSYEDATLDWLKAAFEHAYSRSQGKALTYLKAVVEDMVFEMGMAARKARTVG